MTKKIIFYVSIAFFAILDIILDINIYNYIDVLCKCFNRNITITYLKHTLICFIIALISVLILLAIKLIMSSKKDEIKGINFKTEDGTYGTANWMTEKEIIQVLGITDVPGIILGKYNNNLVKLPFESHFNKNICVFGSSGSMKTIGFLVTNLLELLKYKKSIIVTDAKR